jgi:hypothetical protein
MHAAKQLWCLGLLGLAVSACSTGSDHIVIHTRPTASVWIMADSRSLSGHTHPFVMNPHTLATVLNGVQVEDRDTISGLGILGTDRRRPAFTQAEIAVLVPHLIEALKKASPKDMATFYIVVGDADHRRGVTSGGLFIEEHSRLHLTLANCRSTPRGGQDYTVAMEIDTSDQPLLPVSPHRYRVAFVPEGAWMRHSHSGNEPSFPAYGSAYGDPAKTLVINLEAVAAP